MEPDEDLEAGVRTVAKGAGYMFAGLVVAKALTYLYRLLVARIGTQAYGTLSIGMSIYELGMNVALLGLAQGVARYVAFYRGERKKRDEESVARIGLWTSLFTSMLIAAAVWLFSDALASGFFHDPGLAPIIRLFALSIPLGAVTSIALAVFRGHSNVRNEFLSKSVFESILRIALAAVALVAGYGAFGVYLTYVLAILLSTALCVWMLREFVGLRDSASSAFSSVRAFYSPGIGRELLSYSLPALFWSLSYLAISWMAVYAVAYYYDIEHVGIYNSALPTAMLLLTVAYSVIALFNPVISGLLAKGKMEQLRAVHSRVTKWNLAASLPVALLLVVFSGQVLRILFGNDYSAAAASLAILSIGYLAYNYAGTYVEVLYTTKNQGLLVKFTAVAAVLSFVLNFTLVPVMGITGAAAATAISLGLYGALCVYFASSKYGVEAFSQGNFRVLAASLLSVGAAMALHSALPSKTALSIIVVLASTGITYPVLLLACGGIDAKDRSLLVAAARRILKLR